MMKGYGMGLWYEALQVALRYANQLLDQRAKQRTALMCLSSLGHPLHCFSSALHESRAASDNRCTVSLVRSTEFVWSIQPCSLKVTKIMEEHDAPCQLYGKESLRLHLDKCMLMTSMWKKVPLLLSIDSNSQTILPEKWMLLANKMQRYIVSGTLSFQKGTWNVVTIMPTYPVLCCAVWKDLA
jgi:hypothetical protein